MSNVIPGPPGWPIVGNIRQIDRQKMHVSLYNLMLEYGKIYQFSILSQRFVVISDKALMEKAFGKVELCHRPSTFTDVIKYNGGGILSANFTDSEVRLKTVVFGAIVAVHNDKVVQRLLDEDLDGCLNAIGTKEDVDIVDYLLKTVARQYSIMLMGIEPSERHSDAALDYLASLNNLYSGGKVSILTKLPWMQYCPWIFKPAVAKIKVARDRLVSIFIPDARANHHRGQEHGIIQHLMSHQLTVDRDKKHGEDKPNTTSEDSTFITSTNKAMPICNGNGILNNRHDDKMKKTSVVENQITDENLYATTMDLLTNAVYPTAENVAFVLLQAIKHPEMQEKIHEELGAVGNGATIKDLQPEDLPYLEAFTLECLRYLTLVNISIPNVASGDTELDGYLIPRGTTLIGCLFNANHDESKWDDPWEFSPERFLDDKGRFHTDSRCLRRHLATFSTGIRRCKGEEFGTDRIFYIVAAIFHKYKVLPPVDSELPSSDPRDYATILVINLPNFQCQFEKKI